MGSGLTAVRFASENRFDDSVVCVMLAAVFDGLDGHIARYLDTCSSIGFELDSLCDLANFGVSPALIVYFWAKQLPSSDCLSEGCSFDDAVLWSSCCVYAACCAFRLARFNVQGHAAQMDQQHLEARPEGQRPPVPRALLHNLRQRKMYFQGVPAPVAAAYALTPMILEFSLMPRSADAVRHSPVARRGTVITLLVTAALMVSPVPTFSSKMLKTDRDDTHLRSRHKASLALKVLGGVVYCYIFWNFPFEIFLLANLVHLLSIPASVLSFTLLGCGRSD